MDRQPVVVGLDVEEVGVAALEAVVVALWGCCWRLLVKGKLGRRLERRGSDNRGRHRRRRNDGRDQMKAIVIWRRRRPQATEACMAGSLPSRVSSVVVRRIARLGNYLLPRTQKLDRVADHRLGCHIHIYRTHTFGSRPRRPHRDVWVGSDDGHVGILRGQARIRGLSA